jgi:hypothetical protein
MRTCSGGAAPGPDDTDKVQEVIEVVFDDVHQALSQEFGIAHSDDSTVRR